MKMDCLVIECSASKRDPRLFPHVLLADGQPAAPAWNLYDGRQIRIVRKHYPYCNLDILILSARFGLLAPRSVIPLYNDKLDWQRARDAEWIETHVTESWEWQTDGEVDKYRVVYHALNRAYEHALAAGLREFGIRPIGLVDGYTSAGRRLKSLSEFCRVRHDPTAMVTDLAGVPEVIAFQVALFDAAAQTIR